MKKLITILTVLLIIPSLSAQILSEWRGIDRTGVYENEKNLLTEWPETGPELIWSIDTLPTGYSSAAVVDGNVYLTGLRDTMDVLVALDKTGKIRWETVVGRGWTSSFVDSRATSTIEGTNIYISSGMGDIACINSENGEIIWNKEASKDHGGTYGEWGLSESLLVYGDKVFFTPGGEETTMLAYNKLTGELIWKSESLKDRPSYISPKLVTHNGVKIIASATENYLFGIQPEDGKILWKYDFGQYAMTMGKWLANVQSNTPLYHNGELFYSSGYNHKSVKLKLSEKADAVSVVWLDTVLDVHHGGIVRIDDYLYGANWENNRMGDWVCKEWDSGEIKYEHRWENKGSIISAEGMLYCYEEKRGNIALVKATPDEFKVISTFKTPLGRGPYWAHLVISDGRLYVRHGKALMVYDIRKK